MEKKIRKLFYNLYSVKQGRLYCWTKENSIDKYNKQLVSIKNMKISSRHRKEIKVPHHWTTPLDIYMDAHRKDKNALLPLNAFLDQCSTGTSKVSKQNYLWLSILLSSLVGSSSTAVKYELRVVHKEDFLKVSKSWAAKATITSLLCKLASSLL